MLSKRSLFGSSYGSAKMTNNAVLRVPGQYVHDVTVFTNLSFRIVYTENNGMIFKDMHFKIRLQKFAFSGFQNAFVV